MREPTPGLASRCKRLDSRPGRLAVGLLPPILGRGSYLLRLPSFVLRFHLVLVLVDARTCIFRNHAADLGDRDKKLCSELYASNPAFVCVATPRPSATPSHDLCAQNAHQFRFYLSSNNHLEFLRSKTILTTFCDML